MINPVSGRIPGELVEPLALVLEPLDLRVDRQVLPELLDPRLLRLDLVLVLQLLPPQLLLQTLEISDCCDSLN